MRITFFSHNDDFVLHDEEKIKLWLGSVVESNGKHVGRLSYVFCTDDVMINYNRRFLNHDTYTDIITFDYTEADNVSGDIIISIDRVRENAENFGVSFTDELHRVLVHGVLHLLGQGDKNDEDAAEMRRRENIAINALDNIL